MSAAAHNNVNANSGHYSSAPDRSMQYAWSAKQCDAASQPLHMMWSVPVDGMTIPDGYSFQYTSGWPMQTQLLTPFTGASGIEQGLQYCAQIWQPESQMLAGFTLPPQSETTRHTAPRKKRHGCAAHVQWGNQSQSQEYSNGGEEFMGNLDAPDQDLMDSECQTQVEQMAEGLLRELRSGSNAHKTRAAASFSRYAFQDKVSSRAAQLALETATAAEQVTLASGLHGHVRSAMLSKNGNYVITKAVEVMPVDRAGFIVEELLGHGVEVSRHRFGCRVICRILEHLSPRDENSMKLLDEVLEQAEHLCNHAFGSIVMRHFLEHGLAEHKHRVAIALCADIVTCALQRKGSHVVEAAFRHCSPDDHRLLAERILADSTELVGLATGQFGRHVVVTLLGMDGEKEDVRQQVIKALMPMARELGESKFGKSVCAALSMSTTAIGASASPSRL